MSDNGDGFTSPKSGDRLTLRELKIELAGLAVVAALLMVAAFYFFGQP